MPGNNKMEYKMNDETDALLQWEGRILKKDGICYLGYTNSSVSFRMQGSSLYMHLVTGDNDEINQPGLRVYVDGNPACEVVVDQKDAWYDICWLKDEDIHEIRIVKITEAAMSYVGLKGIRIDEGEISPSGKKQDLRTKVEFIGDSITCGYGVHGEPESEYTIREEDGECSYAAFIAKEMNWNARWISASGYGMFVEYTGNPDNNVPKLYPYVNWFLNKEKKIDPEEFEPKYVFINLGTNDSGHLHHEDIKTGFCKAYEDFLKLVRSYHQNAVIICILGTLCEGVFPYVEQVVEKVKTEGMENVYALELPYHDVKTDGMASMHPSAITHEKDAKRILDFMIKNNL
ncbi:MAG: GDSL-type esterase/lipase family protein [Lachnospiraceae bacterium]